MLVDAGIADDDGPIQRVRVGPVGVDIVDTAPLPEAVDDLPDDPSDRLFVCAHRFAFETATPVALATPDATMTIPVATTDALIAMKSHALAFGRPDWRARKRSSDLYDLYRLASNARPDELAQRLDAAPWDLRRQIHEALARDIGADIEAALAVLRRSPVIEIAETDPDDFFDVITAVLVVLDLT